MIIFGIKVEILRTKFKYRDWNQNFVMKVEINKKKIEKKVFIIKVEMS